MIIIIDINNIIIFSNNNIPSPSGCAGPTTQYRPYTWPKGPGGPGPRPYGPVGPAFLFLGPLFLTSRSNIACSRNVSIASEININ